MILKNFNFAIFLMLLAWFETSCCQREKNVSQEKYTESWESLAQVNNTPDWFLDAKFGIYTHWGPVSTVFRNMAEGQYLDGWHGLMMYGKTGRPDWQTGELKGDPTPNYLHHLKEFGDPLEFGYKQVIEQFNPSAFNAKEWADLFKKSGAQFAGPVAMHHDNFAMWDSKATRWNCKNYGGIDVSKELKTEIEKRGMKFMASFHHAFTWKYYALAHKQGNIDPQDYDLYTEPHEFSSNTPSERFVQEWWAKLKEYIDTYQPDLLWFDWWLENLDESLRQKFLAYYYNKGLEWNKEVAVCFKETTFPEETAIRDYERGRPNQPKNQAWLTDTSPGAWFYRSNAKFVDANELIDILIDIVSKNGAMLLNVPPNPDGSIPQEMKDLLGEVGEWLSVNGEAIYGTRPWTVFGEGPTRLPAGGHKIEEKGKISYTEKDIRFTKSSENVFYAIVMDQPKGDVLIKSLSTQLGILNNDIKKVELLGDDTEVIWERCEDGLKIKQQPYYPSSYAQVFKIICKGYSETDIAGEIKE